MRSSPFGEWVNVFYDPSKTDPATLLDLIKKRDCPRAKRTAGSDPYALNPIIAPGDPVQIGFELENDATLASTSVWPKGWKLVGDAKLKKGKNVLTFSTDRKTRAGNHEIKIEMTDGQHATSKIAVVQQVGRH